MRLLLVGSDYGWSIERTYLKYFKEIAPDVRLFAAQNLFYDWYNRSVVNKLLDRAGLSGILKKINRQFLDVVDEYKPEAVLVFKGMELFPETLKLLRERNIFLANYNPDNPFVFTGRGSGNANVTRSISLYDLHFTYNLEIKARLDKEFGIRTALLPFGFEVAEALYERCRQQEEIKKVCFVGNPDEERVKAIRGLLDKGVVIDVYGHNWDKFITHAGLKVCGAAYGDDFWLTLYRYRVQLNLMRIHNLNSHNMRSFEISGVGGIQLAPDTPEHRLFFGEGKEIFLFRDVEECRARIGQLLGMSDEEAGAIRLAARAKSLAAGYQYRDRARFVWENLSAAGRKG